ncbi:hypothetical protein SH668x_001131 [Planctomicrobium sp. SH668]|uniref:hypothetical protein n=1 Tax=Planctomicrobium sp. SH668 TaxID=3448126 RepID=UPI003F5B6562
MQSIRPVYWFCFAAICLTGSLAAMWPLASRLMQNTSFPSSSPDSVQVEETFYSRLTPTPSSSLLLDEPAETSETLRRFHPFETTEKPVRIQEPATFKHRDAKPIEGSGGQQQLGAIKQTGFLEQNPQPVHAPVWLSESIEPEE